MDFCFDFLSILAQLWEPSWNHLAHLFSDQHGSRGFQEAAKSALRSHFYIFPLQDAPRRSEMRSRRPKTPPSPRRSEIRSRRTPAALKAPQDIQYARKTLPRRPQAAPRRPQGAPRRTEVPPRQLQDAQGRFFTHLRLLNCWTMLGSCSLKFVIVLATIWQYCITNSA